MAYDSSTPLLSNYDNSSNHNPQKTKHPDDVSLEEIIEPYLGGLGWPQILQITLVSFASFFEAQQTFISIFTDAIPSWHCVEEEKGNTTCSSKSDICQLPITSWNWDKPARTSIISEWSLQCYSGDYSIIITGLPASSFFMGCLFGGIILFLLGDSIGRKKMLSLSCFLMSVASIFTAFSNNVWVYSGLRFVSGYGRAAIGTCALVLATESVGKQWQGQVGTIGFLTSTLGFLSLPLIAYVNRSYSWRSIYLLTSIPAVIYCMLIEFCVYESPRWLFAQGRSREAIGVLNTFAGVDCTHLSKKLSFASENETRKLKSKNQQSLVSMLRNKKRVLKHFSLALVIAFGIGVSYYGLPLGIGNLHSDIYLNAAFNGLLEIPSWLMILFTISKWKRSSSMVVLTTIGGFCSLMCFVLGKWKRMELGLELISFFCACSAFDLLLIYTAELFPTCFRNSAVSTIWQAVVLGGVVSPVVIAAAGNYNNLLPYGIFGVVIMSLGLLVNLLPETLGDDDATSVDTLNGQEQESARSCHVDNWV